ncbi:dihydropyrimidine dehydrogenase subunit A [bacterium]|nr:MAG: dihydropyrimidine dehydrogenase subunit A [bacterium]
MSELVFSSWAGAGVDSRKSPATADSVALPKDLGDGTALSAVMGWDGIAVWGGADVVDLARAYAEGLSKNSCGQCVPCRIGSSVIEAALGRICDGTGTNEDVEAVGHLAGNLRVQAMCDLGQSSGKALLDLYENFRDEMLERVAQKKPAKKGDYVVATTAPCKSACPAHLEIPEYVELIKKGQFEESLNLVRRDNCLPGTIGRICVRPCEFNCRRQNVDGPIQIKFLKRFVADYEIERNRPVRITAPEKKGAKIAIVGAGPAGLSCAYFLAQLGYAPVIFEALGEPGGMAAVGIPDYRLPRELLRHEVDIIKDLGVEIRYNTDVGKDISLEDLTGGEYRSVFIAIGARLGTSMGVPGEGDEITGFYKGADYLRDVALGKKVYVGDTAIIVGGGNVAIDCARTALRTGFKKVKIVYRRSEAEMPADKVEITDAKAENIEMVVLTNPKKIVSESGKVTGVEVIDMELGPPDASGRRSPIEKAGSEHIIEADCCIMAIGQAIDLGLLSGAEDIKTTKWKTISVQGLNKLAAVRGNVGVFSGGDCETGPLTLIAGLAAGKEAAFQIDRFLLEGSTQPIREWVINKYVESLKPYSKKEDVGQPKNSEPAKIHHLPVADRVTNTREVEIGFTHEEAIREAERCLRCYRLLVAAKA